MTMHIIPTNRSGRRSLTDIALILTLLTSVACTGTTVETAPARRGEAASTTAMLEALQEPPVVRLHKVLAAHWQVPLGGLLNLDAPAARAAELRDGAEPIELYFYVLEHPRHGVFLIDSGVSAQVADGGAPLSPIVRMAMDTDSMRVEQTTGAWLAERGQTPAGVFLTHIHLDHILGLGDLPADVPVFVGPDETRPTSLEHLFTRGTTDRLLGSQRTLSELQFADDPDEALDGLLDVFGDGSLWALHVPGHTPGSVAFLVHAESGPQLLLGDASHTAWGWAHGVEPGSFSLDQPRSARSLERLRALVKRLPDVAVHPGHQALPVTTAEQTAASASGCAGAAARSEAPSGP